MESVEERILIIRELGRLLIDVNKCSDVQVRNNIYLDIRLLSDILRLTAIY